MGAIIEKNHHCKLLVLPNTWNIDICPARIRSSGCYKFENPGGVAQLSWKLRLRPKLKVITPPPPKEIAGLIKGFLRNHCPLIADLIGARLFLGSLTWHLRGGLRRFPLDTSLCHLLLTLKQKAIVKGAFFFFKRNNQHIAWSSQTCTYLKHINILWYIMTFYILLHLLMQNDLLHHFLE